jgi:hypothetical protein
VKKKTGTKEWLVKVKENQDVLRELIRSYHPATQFSWNSSKLNITALGAEAACDTMREVIRDKSKYLNKPDIMFDVAIKSNDYKTIRDLLGETWIGVPESTSCWGIKGFSEAVDLLDDPPENDEDEFGDEPDAIPSSFDFLD